MRLSLWRLVFLVAVPIHAQGLDPQTRSLIEAFSGHIAVLPPLPNENLTLSPVHQCFAEAGLADQLVVLSPDQFVDTNLFTAQRFPVALYLNYESYFQTVRRDGDGDEALRLYLAGGGTLLVLPQGPFPCYYNQRGQPVGGAARLGLNIGAGSFERPPPGHELAFHALTNQSLVSWPRPVFPFPRPYEADQRWRPSRHPGGEQVRYTPLVSLLDESGGNHGDGAAWLEHLQGPLAGGRVLYVWFSLLANETLRSVVLRDAVRWALRDRWPPPAQLRCWRTRRPPTVDGQLDDRAWNGLPVGGAFKQVGAPAMPPAVPTTVRACWDDQHLYLALVCARPPADSIDPAADSVQIWLAPTSGDGGRLRLVLDPANRLERTAFPGTAVALARPIRSATGQERACWQAELAIPWDCVPLAPLPPRIDTELAAQVVRLLPASASGQPIASSWSAWKSLGDDDRFGHLLLAANPWSDDFEARPEPAGGSANWSLLSGHWRLDRGNLVGENCLADGYEIQGAARGDDSWRDYRFSVRFRIDGRGSDWRDGPWFGLRVRPDGDGYYLAFTDRDCQLHKVVYGVSTQEANPLARADWQPDGQWHSLRVELRANWLEAELDRRRLFRVKDDAHLNLPSLRNGGVVLAARRGSRSQGATVVRFDDVVVEPLEQ